MARLTVTKRTHGNDRIALRIARGLEAIHALPAPLEREDTAIAAIEEV